MTVQEQIEILQAYERGEVIEWKFADGESFKYSITKKVYSENYSFDFTNCRYRIKPKRQRVDTGCSYFCINGFGEINQLTEIDGDADAQLYKIGNYFRTKEDAEKARAVMKECLNKFHEDNIHNRP